MLDPYSRRLLMDALQPPDGYSLDFAVGTTFSLDLIALLTAPLGFTRFELQDSEGADIAESDVYLLLKTIREFADRITIFGQAGRIAVPRGNRPILQMLEEMVVQVVPPTPNRVFHPKVWALRFTHAEQPVVYRLLVMSRNLTFARSWDTILVLDGELQDRANGIAANRPLADFFGALPDMAIPTASPAVRARVHQLHQEIRKVKFELPPDIDDVSFHPLGIPGISTKPFGIDANRTCVISPFLTAGRLAELSKKGGGHVLVSRLDQLRKLSAAQLKGFQEIYFMDPDATIEPEKAHDREADPLNEGADLHAKAYFIEQGRAAYIVTGSANATSAALDGNVEFVVRLSGKKSQLGIDCLFRQEDKGKPATFRSMLAKFEPLDEAELIDQVDEMLDETLDRARTGIASLPWTATVSSDGEDKGSRIVLSAGSAMDLGDGVTSVRVRPILLGEARAVSVGVEGTAEFHGVSDEAITAFHAFEVTAVEANQSRTCRFVVNVTLMGAPTDRRERLLRSMLRDRRQVMRFIMMLLDNDELFGSMHLGTPGEEGRPTRGSFQTDDDDVLLEPLLRALDRDPSRLAQVERVIRDLECGENEESLIPDRLREIFDPIWSAASGRAK